MTPGTSHAHGSVGGRFEQFQWRGGTGQVAARQMHVAHGRREMTVAQKSLHGGQVHAGFDQVGGERVAKAVDRAVLRVRAGLESWA